MSSMRVFISHSSLDGVWCRCFARSLQDLGVDVWYDEFGLYAGEQWAPSVQKQLASRTVFLVILSPNSWSSSWVQEEINLALSLRKPIISVLHIPIEITGFLRNYQMVNVIGVNCTQSARMVADTLSALVATGPNGESRLVTSVEECEIRAGPLLAETCLYAWSLRGKYQILCSQTRFAGEPQEFNSRHRAALNALMDEATSLGWRPTSGYTSTRWYTVRLQRTRIGDWKPPSFATCVILVADMGGERYFGAVDTISRTQYAISARPLLGQDEPSQSYAVNLLALQETMELLRTDGWQPVVVARPAKWYALCFQRTQREEL